MNPKIALIGVGENSYGHPNQETLNKLENLNTKVYRTDQNGEIELFYSISTKIKVRN